MFDRDFTSDITPADGGPLLAPKRPSRRVGSVENVDWSQCRLAQKFGITGETKGGPRRRVNVTPIPGLDVPAVPCPQLVPARGVG